MNGKWTTSERDAQKKFPLNYNLLSGNISLAHDLELTTSFNCNHWSLAVFIICDC